MGRLFISYRRADNDSGREFALRLRERIIEYVLQLEARIETDCAFESRSAFYNWGPELEGGPPFQSLAITRRRLYEAHKRLQRKQQQHPNSRSLGTLVQEIQELLSQSNEILRMLISVLAKLAVTQSCKASAFLFSEFLCPRPRSDLS
jgi:hypothetical protein